MATPMPSTGMRIAALAMQPPAGAGAAPTRRRDMPAQPFRVPVDEDAVDLLLTDQDEMETLLARYERLAADHASADERRDAVEEICSLWVADAAIKEEIFYPAARAHLDEEYLIDEALVAHDSARSLIDAIQAGDPAEPRYDAQVRILRELLAQHFEQERAELFPRVRNCALDLEELGAEMGTRLELLASAGEGAPAGPA
jgi:hypothetical protein